MTPANRFYHSCPAHPRRPFRLPLRNDILFVSYKFLLLAGGRTQQRRNTRSITQWYLHQRRVGQFDLDAFVLRHRYNVSDFQIVDRNGLGVEQCDALCECFGGGFGEEA
jgi:hypothetical protein